MTRNYSKVIPVICCLGAIIFELLCNHEPAMSQGRDSPADYVIPQQHGRINSLGWSSNSEFILVFSDYVAEQSIASTAHRVFPWSPKFPIEGLYAPKTGLWLWKSSERKDSEWIVNDRYGKQVCTPQGPAIYQGIGEQAVWAPDGKSWFQLNQSMKMNEVTKTYASAAGTVVRKFNVDQKNQSHEYWFPGMEFAMSTVRPTSDHRLLMLLAKMNRDYSEIQTLERIDIELNDASAKVDRRTVTVPHMGRQLRLVTYDISNDGKKIAWLFFVLHPDRSSNTSPVPLSGVIVTTDSFGRQIKVVEEFTEKEAHAVYYSPQFCWSPNDHFLAYVRDMDIWVHEFR